MLVKNRLLNTRQNSALPLMAAAITLLLASVAFMFGPQKAQSAPSKNPTATSTGETAANCSKQNANSLRVTLPLNTNRKSSSPVPVNFLGLTSTTFFDEGESQWCWKSTCEHLMWTCTNGGTIRDVNGCCVGCTGLDGHENVDCCPDRPLEN